MFATKFCVLSQNFMSIAYLVLKLLQNIVQGVGAGGQLELSQLQWLKPYVEFNTKKKRIEAEKMAAKMEKHYTN